MTVNEKISLSEKSEEDAELKGSPFVLDENDDSIVQYSRLGIWHHYKVVKPPAFLKRFSMLDKVWTSYESYKEAADSLPYVWRLVQDVSRLSGVLPMLCAHAIILLLSSFVPAVSLWFKGQMLQIVDTAISQRTVDTNLLLMIAVGRATCSISERLLNMANGHVHRRLTRLTRTFFANRVLNARAKLDVPTFADPTTLKDINAQGVTRGGMWPLLNSLSHIFSVIIQLVTQFVVIISIVRHQRDGVVLASVCFLSYVTRLAANDGVERAYNTGAWAATCRDDDYVRMMGLQQLIGQKMYRQELVANGMADNIVADYIGVQDKLGEDAVDFHEAKQNAIARQWPISRLLDDPLNMLPQVIFVLRAVQYPTSIPLSLASIQLIQSTVSSFSHSVLGLYMQTFSLSQQLAGARQFYQLSEIQNQIPDGTIPFPENAQSLRNGISVEFRNVSFQYPGAEALALKDVSFTVHTGQLCVIVGTNGSGKSTILKLIARIYDVTEGEILVNGTNIKKLVLKDLRKAMSVLFQDYTHFPVSIRHNIALGDPDSPFDPERVRRAAELGGAADFIAKMPEGFETYLYSPVPDYYGNLPEGTKSVFQRKVHQGTNRRGRPVVKGSTRASNVDLSGGQKQRLAVARTFMRSMDPESSSRVGMLLFDEPSASLDPLAEHDLFERLRELRGSKTMFFSSHRFGNLTRHADIIICMKDAVVEEIGTHDHLVAQGGGYAKIYNVQSQAFK